MAVLGFQLITTLVGSVFLSKIVAHFSFTRYVYSGLERRAVPTNSQLLEASGNHRIKSKGKKRKSEISGTDGSGSPDVFYFPRTVSLKLESCQVFPSDVATLPLYSSFQWLLDFTVCTMGVYLVTEIAQSTVPLWIAHLAFNKPIPFFISGNQNSPSSGVFLINNKLNLSLLWLTLTLWFTVRTMLSMTGIYFHSSRQTVVQSNPPQSPTVPGTHHSASDSDSNAEWFLVLSAAFIFLILSGFFLALDGRHFDFGLASGYANLTMNTTASTNVPWMSWGAFHIILAVTCATIGALLVYPGLKFGRIYLDAVSRFTTPWYKRLLFHLTFISPLLPILLWIKPVTDHLFHALTQLGFHPTVIQRPGLQLAVSVACELLSTHLDTVRLLLCVWILLLRVGITRWCLQIEYTHESQMRSANSSNSLRFADFFFLFLSIPFFVAFHPLLTGLIGCQTLSNVSSPGASR
ncbi:unnamed protein product [Dicrocoelium dendriticum]|nr:unnamed protein product [Dicrocoelium dendriticum]